MLASFCPVSYDTGCLSCFNYCHTGKALSTVLVGRAVRLDIDVTGFHWFLAIDFRCAWHVTIIYVLQYSICMWVLDTGWLTLNAKHISRGMEVKTKSTSCVIFLCINNYWTRSFTLEYWLFFFSYVLNQMRKNFPGKIFTQVSMHVAFRPCHYWDQSKLHQLVFSLFQTHLLLDCFCEAYEVNTCSVFTFKSVWTYEVNT